MNAKPTRRTVGKFLLAAPVALAATDLSCRTAAAPPGAVSPGLTPRERQDLEKAVSQLRKALDRLRQMPIPMGSEPALIFDAIVFKT